MSIDILDESARPNKFAVLLGIASPDLGPFLALPESQELSGEHAPHVCCFHDPQHETAVQTDLT